MTNTNRTIINYIKECVSNQGFILMGLIDPDKKDLLIIKNLAKEMEIGGIDIILIGGSTGAEGEQVSECAKIIKETVNVPIVLFPGNPGGITKYADATYFMDIINSGDNYWNSQYKILMAPIIEKADIEYIPTTYIIVEPGETVGWVTNARVIPRSKKELGLICALAGKFSGSEFIIMDCGSGNPNGPPIELIQYVSSNISEYLIYAGGIKTNEDARNVIAAGAKGIHIGNITENSTDVSNKIMELKNSMSLGYMEKMENIQNAIKVST